MNQILKEEILEVPQLPEKYLNSRSLNYIIGCIEDKEVKNLSEAINLLEIPEKEVKEIEKYFQS